MSELQLGFPGCRFTLRGPRSALRQVSLLYHPAHLAPPPEKSSRLAGVFTLAEAGNGWRLSAEDEREPLGVYAETFHALLAMEHSIEARILAGLEGSVALHAGAVVVDGGACLLMGRADSGKSSTTFQLLELGHTFLAEEIAVIDDRSRVRPHLQSIALDPRVVDEYRQIRALEHGRLTPIDDLLYRYRPSRAVTVPAPLITIVLPSYRPTSAAAVDTLGIEETLIELLGYCFEPAGDPELLIERLIELFGSARLLRLTYPDASSARRTLAELFGHGTS